jgi:Ni,Fe-hydrogenase III large subunit
MSDAYRAAVADAVAGPWRFAGLHASAGGNLVHTALAGPEGQVRLETVAVVHGSVPTIVDLAPGAAWDEREAADLYGVGFTGHQPLRPLVEHDLELDHWTVPIHGHDAYQVAVGPIHAGVIESGHFRFHVVGDRILHVDARLFYKHRGLERAAEGHTVEEGLAYAMRACAACAVANSVAYAHACEDALGLEPTRDLAQARTILLELERVWNHLNDIAAVCAGVGLAAGNTLFAALTERARRLNETLTGHRFLFGAVAVGEGRFTLDENQAGAARSELAALAAESRRGWRELIFNTSFQDRLPGIGVVTRRAALALGAVGPAARSAGLAEDVREASDRLAYDGFAAVTPEEPAGDAGARLEQRALELRQSFDILDRLLAEPVASGGLEPSRPERTTGLGRVESPRGATLCVVEQAAGRIERLRLRTGSYANWPVVAHAAAGNLLPDFPLINKSFELCYACADR